MNLTKLVKRTTMVVVSVIGLSIFTPVPAHAEPATETAQKLVDSLKTIEVEHIDYLYTHMQSVKLSKSEYSKIITNAEQVAVILTGVTDPTELTKANRIEVLRLFKESAQLAQVKIDFFDHKGKKISLTDYKFDNGLFLQITDLNGKLFATINPSKAELDPTVLATKMDALKIAVDAKMILDKTGKRFPMPNPPTSTNLPITIAIGALLIIIGGVVLRPALNMANKTVK